MAGLNALRTEGWNSKGRGYVHANGRLHWNSTGLRQPGKRQAWMPGQERAMSYVQANEAFEAWQTA